LPYRLRVKPDKEELERILATRRRIALAVGVLLIFIALAGMVPAVTKETITDWRAGSSSIWHGSSWE